MDLCEIYVRTNALLKTYFSDTQLSSCKRSNNAVKIPQAVAFSPWQHKLDKAKHLFESDPNVTNLRGNWSGPLIVKKGLKSPVMR